MGREANGAVHVPLRVLSKARRTGRRMSTACQRQARRVRIALSTWFRCGRHHVAEIDPFRLIWMDPWEPERLMDYTSPEFFEEVWDVRGGDWDLGRPRLEDDGQYTSLMSHLRDGVPWKETPFIQEVLRRVAAGQRFWHGCRSKEEVEARCERIDGLLKSIRRNGFRTQRELEAEGVSVSRRSHPPELEEIVVNVDRNGKFIFANGIHRLVIARTLGLDRVPVCVLVRHRRWQEYRDSIVRDPFRGGGPSLDHPDLSYLLFDRRPVPPVGEVGGPGRRTVTEDRR